MDFLNHREAGVVYSLQERTEETVRGCVSLKK
jgi:hypothetical protein